MREHPYSRVGDLRQIIASRSSSGKFKIQTPYIEHHSTGMEWIVNTKVDQRTVKRSTPPSGIVFVDDSFLTIYEKWDTSGELLGYKYHYQSGDQDVRYELDEEKRENIPQHHMNTSFIKDAHVPCGGAPVDFGEVLDMIIQDFVP